jgi:hypothetical protein
MNKILQFKISLKRSNPKIWRRFQIENNLMFFDLHLVIQGVMGWTNTHLYQFVYEKNSYIGNPEMLDYYDVSDDKITELSVFFDKSKMKILYEYDFGDDWVHELVLEKILDKNDIQQYPICLEGELACPIEDSGGIFGYYNLMEKYNNSKDDEHSDTVEWVGEDFNPEFFDIESVNEILKDYKRIDLGFN